MATARPSPTWTFLLAGIAIAEAWLAPPVWGDASSLLQGDVRVGSPAELQPEHEQDASRQAAPQPAQNASSLGQPAQLVAAAPGGKPSAAKHVAAWVVPLVLMVVSVFLPWLHERGDGAGEKAADSASEPSDPIEIQKSRAAGPKDPPDSAEDPPPSGAVRGYCDIICRMGYLWPSIILDSLSQGIIGPSGAFIGQNFFATHHTSLPHSEIHCEINPTATYCREAVMDVTQVNMYTQLAAPILQVLLGPAIGTLSDSWGRRPVIVGVILIQFIPSIFMALHMFQGTSLWFFYYFTPLGSLPISSVYYAYVIDVMRDPNSLAVAFSTQMAAGTLSGLFALAAGSSLKLQSAFTVSFALTCLGTAYIALILPESLAAKERRPLKPRSLLPWFGLTILVRNVLLARLTYIAVVSSFTDSGFGSVTMSWLQLYLNFGAHDSYIRGIVYCISTIFWLTFGMKVVVGWFGEAGVLNVSRWAGVAYGIAYMFITQVWHLFVMEALLLGPCTLAIPCIAAIKGRVISASEQGQLQSALTTVTSISSSLGPLCFGIIFRATNAVNGVRTKASNAIFIDAIVQSVPVLMMLFTIPWLLRKYDRSQTQEPVRKSLKLSQ